MWINTVDRYFRLDYFFFTLLVWVAYERISYLGVHALLPIHFEHDLVEKHIVISTSLTSLHS